MPDKLTAKLGRAPQSIAIVRALKLGDFLVTVPALRALRGAFPDAHIDYVGLPATEELVQRYGQFLSGFVPFPGFPGLPEWEYDVHDIAAFINDMQAKHYDVVLQMHGKGGVINPLAELLGGEATAGYACDESVWPNHDLFMEYPDRGHQIRRHLQLMEFLGIPAKGEQLEFPIAEADVVELGGVFDAHAVRYACIHAGAISGGRWPVEQFAAVADKLAGLGIATVLTGSQSEHALAEEVIKHMVTPALNLAGTTTLGSLAALLRSSVLLISNDTGVAHLAYAVGTPSITIFTTSDPDIWGPLDRQRHSVISASEATPDSVFAAATSLLSAEKENE